MKWTTISIVTLVMLVLLWSTSSMAQNPSRAELLASSCFVCHGQGAKGALKIPPLNDLKVSDIKESMIGFKSGEERSTIMGIIAKEYSREDIILLAEYLAALPD